MLNIIIIGCGDLGRYIATILSKEKNNVIVVDRDPAALKATTALSDIAIKQGSGTDWQLLDDLLEFSPDVLLALTGNDETNLVSCLIAKQLQYPRTIVRINESQFLNQSRLDFGRIFDVDYFLNPELSIAHDILKQVISPSSLVVENFAHGALQLRTILIPEDWKEGGVLLRDFKFSGNVIVGLIRRTLQDENTGEMITKIIFPHGDDAILPNDEVTFIGETDVVSHLHRAFGIEQQNCESVVIIGGSLTAIYLANLLTQRAIRVKIIERDYNQCSMLSQKLPNCIIVHHEETDKDFLQSENIGAADLVVACTDRDEVNILSAMLAKDAGCRNVIVVLSNPNYIPIVNKLAIRHTMSPRINAANQILSQLFSGQVSSLISLYENQAEVMEINVSLDSKIVGIPLCDLGPFLPRDLLIVMIQNRGRIMIANGNRIISPGDTVIVVTDPKNIDELKRIF